MSEVTAKDLREHIKQCYYLAPHGYPTPERDEKRKKYLAAFDAMAEKAELLDKAEKYLQQTLSESRLVSIARSDLRQFKVQIGKLGYPPDGYGNTLVETLKAVKE